ncbi:MAG: hypothetical protein K2X82_25020 [Gemmataceae bacterium]|nr:hypothetical protein [Gemmataceae bacterium]
MNWTPILINWAFWLVVTALFLGYWYVRIERGHRRRMAAIEEAEAADRARAEARSRAWDEQVARWDAERAAAEARLKALSAEIDAELERDEAALAAEPAAGAGSAAGEPHPEAVP